MLNSNNFFILDYNKLSNDRTPFYLNLKKIVQKKKTFLEGLRKIKRC